MQIVPAASIRRSVSEMPREPTGYGGDCRGSSNDQWRESPPRDAAQTRYALARTARAAAANLRAPIDAAWLPPLHSWRETLRTARCRSPTPRARTILQKDRD